MDEIKAAINVQIPVPVAHGVARIRMSFATQHILAARRLALAVHKLEKENRANPSDDVLQDVLAHVPAVIMLSIASLEAYLNEIVDGGPTSFPAQSAELVQEALMFIERAKMREKIDFLPVLNGRSKPDFGSKPAQDVGHLIELRNALVHFHPEWWGEDNPHTKLGKRLVTIFKPNPFYDEGVPLFPMRCLGYGCAKWAVETVRDFTIGYADANGWPCGLKDQLSTLTLPADAT